MKKVWLCLIILLLLPSLSYGKTSKRFRRRQLLKQRRATAKQKLVLNRKGRCNICPHLIRKYPYASWQCNYYEVMRREGMYNLQHGRQWKKLKNRAYTKNMYRKDSPICTSHKAPKYEKNLYRRKHAKTPKHWPNK